CVYSDRFYPYWSGLPCSDSARPLDVEEQELPASTPSLRRRLASPRFIIGRRAFVWDMPALGARQRTSGRTRSRRGRPSEAAAGGPLIRSFYFNKTHVVDRTS